MRPGKSIWVEEGTLICIGDKPYKVVTGETHDQLLKDELLALSLADFQVDAVSCENHNSFKTKVTTHTVQVIHESLR